MSTSKPEHSAQTRREFLTTVAVGGAAMLGLTRCGGTVAGKDFGPAHGIVPPLLTPFTSDGQVDYDAYDRLIDWHVERGVTGVFIICSSSESRHLTEAEALRMAGAAVRRSAGRINVLAGSSLHPDLADNIAMTRRMADTGVDGCFITTPRLQADDSTPIDDRMLGYYTAIHDAVACPVYGYEIPGVYHFAPKVLASLGRLERFIGLKDTSTRIDIPPDEALAPVRAKLAAVDGTVKIMQANTARLLASFEIGCTGGINQSANVASSLFVKLHALWESGDLELARALQERIVEIDGILHYGFMKSAKVAMGMMGLEMEPVCRQQSGEYDTLDADALRRMVALIQRAEDEFEIARSG